MSGHSKWHRIKHKKAQTDSKRSQLFGRLSRDIRVATQKGGRDPSLNAALRVALERAKKYNLPQANIDRLLNKDASNVTSVVYEGYGPGGVAVLVEAVTDNTNRTVSEMRTVFKKHSGNLGEPGSVRWKFTPTLRTTALLPDSVSREEIELGLIDAGADDITFNGSEVAVSSQPPTEAGIKDILQQHGAQEIYSETNLSAPPSQLVPLSDEDHSKLDTLLDTITEHSDVEIVYHDAQPR